MKHRVHLTGIRSIPPKDERAYRRAWELLLEGNPQPSHEPERTPENENDCTKEDDESGPVPPGFDRTAD
jgi:hypothetical protein